jgi:carboxymethylenebutenolidase
MLSSALLGLWLAAGASPAPSTAAVALPPAEEIAKAALDHSPRHGEWADVKLADGHKLRTWVVYPERKGKAPVVILIHEIFGLTDWARSVADQLAAEGFIAVAPDLISGKGPGGGGTDAVASRDDVVKLVRELTPDVVRGQLDAVRAWALALPSASAKSATIGFCWGGGQSFQYATSQAGLSAAVVYYGVSPDAEALAHLHAPVLGLYGGDDERVGATIAPAQAVLKKTGGSYEPHSFEGAGHGFLRQQGDRAGANLRAAQQAWPATIAFLRKHLE